MLKIVAILSVFVLATASATEFAITKAGFSNRPRHFVPRAISGPIEDCGVSQIVDLRLSGCSQTPCTLNRGSAYELEVDFISRDWHADMRIRAILRQDSQLQILQDDTTIPDSTLNPGQMYTMRLNFNAQAGFSGPSQLRLKIYQNYVSEVCWVIPVNIA